MIKQRTLTNVIKGTGVGLHRGEKIQLTLRPAPSGTGIIFRRVDLDPVCSIPALVEYVSDTRLSTTLGNNGHSVSTVEHLLSVFAGLGIDNAFVDVSGAEVPIMDGSAAPFVFLIQSAGIEEQKASKKFIRIKKSIEVKDGDKWARFDPFDGFKISFEIDFDHPMFRSSPQKIEIDFANASFVRNISRARTFGFMHELEHLQEEGYAQGGSKLNAIVMDRHRMLNDDPLRYADELVKHKVLDSIGDMYLLGHQLIGAFSAYKSGHQLNNHLLNELNADQSAWETVTFGAYEEMPKTLVMPVPRTI